MRKYISALMKGNETVLKNINLSLEANNFIGIVGQSGSGKSTLMKLASLYTSDKGRILIDGYDIQKLNWTHFEVKWE